MNEQKTSIHQGHRQRLRDRYNEQGADGFQDHELLELLLSYGISRKDTNPLGHELLSRFGSLRGVLEAETEDLLAVPGIGEHVAFLLKLVPGLMRRYYEELDESSNLFGDTAKQMAFFVPRFFGRKRECLFAAFLDENTRLIKCELQYEGSINAVEIHMERILQTALKLGAKQVVISHNHLNNPYPSPEDIRVTEGLSHLLDEFGITLLDHIVVCETKATSMLESGHITRKTH